MGVLPLTVFTHPSSAVGEGGATQRVQLTFQRLIARQQGQQHVGRGAVPLTHAGTQQTGHGPPAPSRQLLNTSAGAASSAVPLLTGLTTGAQERRCVGMTLLL